MMVARPASPRAPRKPKRPSTPLSRKWVRESHAKAKATKLTQQQVDAAAFYHSFGTRL